AAARALGCPEGTVATRLAWARDRLRHQLTRRGVTLGIGAMALDGLLTQHASASVPTALAQATVRHAAVILGADPGALPAALQARARPDAKHLVPMRATVLGLVLLATIAVAVGLSSRQPPNQTPALPTEASLPRQPAVDQYGDPLPASAVLRLGTVQLR